MFGDRAVDVPDAYWLLTEKAKSRPAVSAFVAWLFEAAAADAVPREPRDRADGGAGRER